MTEAKDYNGVSPRALKVAMKKAAQGNHKAFDIIYNAFYEKLFILFFTKYKMDDNVAEDLASEVVTKVWERANKYKPEVANVTTWIHNMAHNHYIDYWRQNQKRNSIFKIYDVLFTDYRYERPGFDVHQLSETPEQLMIQEETKDFAKGLLCSEILGENMLKIMELRYLKELSLKEVAKKLKMNDNTLRVQVMRAKKEIKKYIDVNGFASQYALPQLS